MSALPCPPDSLVQLAGAVLWCLSRAGWFAGRVISAPHACPLAKQGHGWKLVWMAMVVCGPRRGTSPVAISLKSKKESLNSIRMSAIMFIAKREGQCESVAAYVVGCNLFDKVNLKMKLIVKLIIKVAPYFIIRPCFGSLALLLQFCHLDCIFHACAYFCSVLWEKLSWNRSAVSLLVSHQQDLSLLWSATGIRN